ncbi:MAG: hypothetical protein GXO39_05885 [Thermotogae bacterium]|nr:hypothetical protein [Thermotogota bacterium]
MIGILIGWVVAPVITDTVYVGDTCPGTAVDSALMGVPSAYACADVMFVFDRTGSMTSELSYAVANANAIMDSLMASISDVRFGAASHADYPASYSYCGYSNTYGSSSDYPYSLNQPLTYDTATVRAVLSSISSTLYGADGPESYARALWEMLHDTAIGWRAECARFVIFWLDNIPHACDLNDLSRAYSYNTGTDPGRDAVAGTSDDILWYPLLHDLRTSGITPIIMVSALISGYLNAWQYWMSDTLANGIATIRGSGIARQIDSIVDATADVVDSLWPQVREATYAPWVSFTPPYYTDITLTPPEDTFSFTIHFNVPSTTPRGLYTFHIDYYRDAIRVDTQLVNLYVENCTIGWDDPTAISERKENSLYVAGTIINVPQEYQVEIYTVDGKRILTLSAGKHDLRSVLKPGVYLGRTSGPKSVVFKIIIR